ncbi:MAG: ABC transporter substrate-binding protein [Chloroflexi bacterium]|nr:ABC transporter substrate-binding protein [Chloroflexota bacterium]
MHARRLSLACVIVLGMALASCAPAAAPAKEAPKPAVPAAAPTGAPAKAPLPAATPKPAASPAGPAATPKPTGEQPRYGGTMTVSTVGDPPSFDSQQETTINTQMVVAPAYNNLVAYDPFTGKEIAPDLAESWQMSPDGLQYTFKMRTGIKWHDGQPFTVQDAAFSLQKIVFPPRGVRSARGFFLDEVLDKIETPDANTLKLTLKYSLAFTMSVLVDDAVKMFPKHVLEKDMRAMMKSVVGTGPFKFKAYNPGVSIEHVKNQDYWVKGRPYLDGVTFYIIKDAYTRIAALRTGRVLRTGTRFAALAPAHVEAVKQSTPEIRFAPEAAMAGPGLFLNVRRPPFKDLRVRKAISLALDRQAGLKTLTEGQGMLARVFPFEGWGHTDEELSKWPGWRQPKDQDIAEARKLMADAGYADGFPLTIKSRTTLAASNGAVFLTNQLTSIGIKSTVEILEDAQFYAARDEARFDALVFTPTTSIPDVDWMAKYFAPGGSSNYTGNDDDKKLADMYDKQRREIDVAKRKALIREMERYAMEESLVWIQVTWPKVMYGYWPQVRGMILGVISDAAHHDFQEVWLAK